jgi:hypothetical protein
MHGHCVVCDEAQFFSVAAAPSFGNKFLKREATQRQ